jgi:hypothetical protein
MIYLGKTDSLKQSILLLSFGKIPLLQKLLESSHIQRQLMRITLFMKRNPRRKHKTCTPDA